ATSTGGDAVGIFVGALTGGEGPTGVSTFTGGITNEGTIFATANGGALDGIAIGIGVGQLHATIGGFLNGVETFSGGITNSGLIHASAQSGIAIGIMVGNPGFISESSIGYGGVSTFSGGILNTGTIIATATNQPESLIGANAFGILVNGAFFTGSGYFAGIQTFNDGISNSGVIQVSAHSSGYHQAAGIAAWFVSTFNGGIQNSGTITAISDGNGGAKADEAKAYGIYVYGISTFNGGISNSGTITALAPHGTNDSAVGIYVSGVPTFNGGIFNSGTIVAGGTSGVNAATYATGIDVNLVATFHGGISNSGVISATGGQFAGGIVVNVFSLFDGGITNSGSIFATSVDTGGFAEGIGIDPSVFIGNVYNSGLIKVEAVQTAVGVDVQASTFNGGIVNTETGIIHVIGGGEGGGAAYGIRLHNISVFVGGIENAGTISVENRYVGNTNIKAYGIYIDVSSFGGGITNSGLIKALTTSLDPVKVQGASGIGIFSTSAVVGTITNTGTIIGTNWAIDLSQSQGSNTINTSAGFIGGGINLSDTFTDFVNISGGTVEASIRGQAAVVNMTDGLLTVPIDRSFVQSDGVTRDFTQYKSVGTMVAPIATFTATGGTINFALDGTPADPLTGVGTNTLTGGGVEVRNGFIFARTTTVTNGVGFTVTPMPDLYLDGTIYHQVLNGQSQFSGPDTPALVSIVTPGGTVPSTLLMTFTLNPDDCMANLASCAGNLTGEGGADQINLSVRKFENPLGVGLTPNEIQAGRGLDALAHSPNGLLAFGTSQNLSLGGLFLITDPKTYQTALDQLGGYQIAQGFNLSMGIPIYTGESIQTLLAAGPNRGGMVQSARLTNSGIQIAAAGKIVTDADSPTQVAQGAAGPSAAPWTFWGRGYGVWGNADSQTSPNHVAGYNETRGGGIFGADYTFNENWLLGGVVNYSHSNMDFDQNLGNTDLDNFLLGIYGQYRSGPWYVNGTFQGGWDWYTTNRNIFVPIKATAHSSYNGSTYGIYGETGWDFLLNSWKLTPFVGFGWVHGHIDSFTESGAGPADLAVHDSSEDSIQSTLGGRISTRLPLWGSFIVPEVRAAWQHEFGDQAHTINNSFALSPSGVFTQQGTEFGRDAGVFGVSLTYEVRSDMKVFADFDYKTMSSYNAEAVMAGLKLSFGAPAPLPPKVAPAAQPAPPPPPTARLFIVYFDFNKSDLTADGQKVVDQAVATFKQTGSVQVKIDGYTDLAGTQAYNLGLSKKRADIVRAAMVKGGVPANSIVEAWHGKENPAVPTADGVREARNRRAEILLP
ncbi:MAG TPA: autotransporter domain-containing protein, partial [Stellaceae bacterium]|nr:autotransporter domain-containing protein [Stellaceae bacterium]